MCYVSKSPHALRSKKKWLEFVKKSARGVRQPFARIVSFTESSNEEADLREKIESAFQEVFSTPPAPFYIQIFSDDWNRFIDICPGQEIPNKAMIRIILKESKVRKNLYYEKSDGIYTMKLFSL